MFEKKLFIFQKKKKKKKKILTDCYKYSVLKINEFEAYVMQLHLTHVESIIFFCFQSSSFVII